MVLVISWVKVCFLVAFNGVFVDFKWIVFLELWWCGLLSSGFLWWLLWWFVWLKYLVLLVLLRWVCVCVCDQPCLPRDQSIVVHLPSQHVQNSTLQRRGTWRAIRDHVQRSYLIAREAKADHLCVPANNMFELLTKLSNSWFGFMVVHADQDLKHVISWFQWRRYPALDLSFFRVSSHDLSHLGFKTTSVCRLSYTWQGPAVTWGGPACDSTCLSTFFVTTAVLQSNTVVFFCFSVPH